MGYETLLLKKEGPILFLAFNRPEQLNAVNTLLLFELKRVVTELKEDSETRFLVVTGKGRAFSAGADLRERREAAVEEGPFGPDFIKSQRQRQRFGHQLMRDFENLEQITVAALNGVVRGAGVALALACDFRIATTETTLGIPETNVGIFFSWGSTARLTRLVGPAKAKELIMTCDVLSAQEALALGLVHKVVPPAELMEAVRTLIAKVAVRAPHAVRMTKTIVNALSTPALGDVTFYEPDLVECCYSYGDMKEAIRAFFEKRTPEFTGK